MSQITVEFDRRSVHAGDDAYDHRTSWTLPGDATVADLVRSILSERVLASIAGDVSWTVWLGRARDGVKLAVIDVPRGQAATPRLLGNDSATLGELADERRVVRIFVE